MSEIFERFEFPKDPAAEKIKDLCKEWADELDEAVDSDEFQSSTNFSYMSQMNEYLRREGLQGKAASVSGKIRPQLEVYEELIAEMVARYDLTYETDEIGEFLDVQNLPVYLAEVNHVVMQGGELGVQDVIGLTFYMPDVLPLEDSEGNMRMSEGIEPELIMLPHDIKELEFTELSGQYIRRELRLDAGSTVDMLLYDVANTSSCSEALQCMQQHEYIQLSSTLLHDYGRDAVMTQLNALLEAEVPVEPVMARITLACQAESGEILREQCMAHIDGLAFTEDEAKSDDRSVLLRMGLVLQLPPQDGNDEMSYHVVDVAAIERVEFLRTSEATIEALARVALGGKMDLSPWRQAEHGNENDEWHDDVFDDDGDFDEATETQLFGESPAQKAEQCMSDVRSLLGHRFASEEEADRATREILDRFARLQALQLYNGVSMIYIDDCKTTHYKPAQIETMNNQDQMVEGVLLQPSHVLIDTVAGLIVRNEIDIIPEGEGWRLTLDMKICPPMPHYMQLQSGELHMNEYITVRDVQPRQLMLGSERAKRQLENAEFQIEMADVSEFTRQRLRGLQQAIAVCDTTTEGSQVPAQIINQLTALHNHEKETVCDILRVLLQGRTAAYVGDNSGETCRILTVETRESDHFIIFVSYQGELDRLTAEEFLNFRVMKLY